MTLLCKKMFLVSTANLPNTSLASKKQARTLLRAM